VERGEIVYARVLKIWYTMVIATVVPGQWFMVSGTWWRGGEVLYSRSTVNFKGYYYLIDLNVYVTVLKASPPVLYNIIMYLEKGFRSDVHRVDRVKVPQREMECVKRKKNVFVFDFQESRKMCCYFKHLRFIS